MLRKIIGTAIGAVLALALLGFVPQSHADARNQSTQFTFNKPVRLPNNVVLPAGTYWFLAPDTINAGNTVQVYNGDRTKLLGTFETITNDRPDPNMAGKMQLRVGTEPGQPPMIMGWIYPGQTQGHEFVYSSQRESQLAESGKLVVVDIGNGGTVTIG
jgi:hypothetical protein